MEEKGMIKLEEHVTSDGTRVLKQSFCSFNKGGISVEEANNLVAKLTHQMAQNVAAFENKNNSLKEENQEQH